MWLQICMAGPMTAYRCEITSVLAAKVVKIYNIFIPLPWSAGLALACWLRLVSRFSMIFCHRRLRKSLLNRCICCWLSKISGDRGTDIVKTVWISWCLLKALRHNNYLWWDDVYKVWQSKPRTKWFKENLCFTFMLYWFLGQKLNGSTAN